MSQVTVVNVATKTRTIAEEMNMTEVVNVVLATRTAKSDTGTIKEVSEPSEDEGQEAAKVGSTDTKTKPYAKSKARRSWVKTLASMVR